MPFRLVAYRASRWGWLRKSALLVVISVAACSGPPRACREVQLDSLLVHARERLGFTGTYFPSPAADSIRVGQGDTSLLWLGVRWSGPDDGAILLVNCGAQVVSALRLGATDSLRRGPRLSGLPYTVLAYVNPGGGTGAAYRQVALVSSRGPDSLFTVWAEMLFQGDYSTPMHRGSETVREVSMTPSGDTIRVSGILRILRYQTDRNVWLAIDSQRVPARLLCWSSQALAYRDCGP
jgi:hypothetical protein